MISKSKIDKIGEIIKKGDDLKPNELAGLLEWRNGFSDTLDYFYRKLGEQINEEKRVGLVRRLKRIESIKIKLKRFRTMRLSTFQDIAGIRVVVIDPSALDEVYTQLRIQSTKHKLKRIDDYHKTPKKDGYRGIHLVYQTQSKLQVEIQLRTELEHVWATAVETYGELQKTSFKTGEGENDWKDFFQLLSSYFAILENCQPTEEHIKLTKAKVRSQLKTKIKSMKVIEKLNAFTNNIETTLEKHNKTGRQGKYALIELDITNKTTRVELFNKKDQAKAIEIYTEKELRNDDKNYVFVNIDDVERIQETYPNYFLNTRRLLQLLSKIVLGEI